MWYPLKRLEFQNECPVPLNAQARACDEAMTTARSTTVRKTPERLPIVAVASEPDEGLIEARAHLAVHDDVRECVARPLLCCVKSELTDSSKTMYVRY